MNIEKMREEFEAWAKTGDNPLFDEDMRWMASRNTYYFSVVRYMWDAWQASRESLEIELPPSHDMGITKPDLMMDSCRVISAIAAAGIKVKP